MNQDQFELTPYVEAAPKRKGRGKGKKPALVYVGVRLERETLDFYNRFENRQEAMRGALKYYIDQYNQAKEQQNAN